MLKNSGIHVLKRKNVKLGKEQYYATYAFSLMTLRPHLLTTQSYQSFLSLE